jgi:glucosyl-dolichyl phosphate glucuronosyltransferase
LNISIVVCTYNRGPLLAQTLESIVGQAVNDRITWETIVIDNASSDNTPIIAAKYNTAHQNISVFREDQQGLSHARNRGITEASGQLLCFIDDDVLLPPDYISRAWSCWQNGGWDVAGGRAIGN